MAKLSKRQRLNVERLDATKRYSYAEAFALLKSFKPAKFDESVDVAIRLGVDPKKSDQMVRGVARLPHGTGRKIRILVLAKGEHASAAQAAGADFVGDDDLIEKISGGWLEFDKVIATPEMMPKVGAIAKILGPRGLMPNPKVGTVTTDVASAVKEERAGKVEFRVEKAGILHVPIGRISFSVEQLEGNLQVLMEQVVRAKPATAKGIYLQGASVASTMSPGIRLDVSKATAAAAGA